MNPAGLHIRSTTFNTPVSNSSNDRTASTSKMAIRDTGTRSPSPVTVQPQSVSFVSSEQKGKKKDWVGSASKRLRLPKLREKASSTQVQEALINSKDTTRKLIIGSTKSSATTPTQTQRPQQSKLDRSEPPKKSSSPIDKPLPSLPVAIVDYKSPVRRSLIDCAERPLRRSVSPLDGGLLNEEVWPSMQPSNGTTTTFPEPCKGQTKPSLGESIIDGLRSLNLQDNEDITDNKYSAVDFENPLIKKDFNSQASEKNTHSPLKVCDNDSNRPLSSSQLPKPRDSMLHSLRRHNENPVIRQTKTSAMRLQNAMGKRTWSSGEKSEANEDALSSIQEHPKLLSKSKQIHGYVPGPIRSASRGRHAVTVRGSPYIIPSRAPSRANTASPANQQEMNLADQSMMVSIGLQTPTSNGLDNSGRKVSTARDGSRQSSLPIPSRLKDERASAGRASVSPQQQSPPDETLKSAESREIEEIRATATDPANSQSSDQSPTVEDSCIDLRDALSSPVPQDQNSAVRRTDNSHSSTRGYDAHGGFRLKHLGNGLLDGPTLRINDSASRILLGTDETAATSAVALPPRSSVTNRRKRSAPELSQRKDQKISSRPTSALFDRPLSFIARNIADRTSEIKVLDDDEVRKLIGEGSSPSKSEPAELPGSDVVFVCDSRPSSLIAKHVTQDSWENQKSPLHVQCDWPGKDFAEFNLCPSPDRSPPKAKEPSLSKNGDSSKSKSSIYTDAEPPKTGSASIKSITSRPSTIALRAPPSKEIAPFLFQNAGNLEKKGKEPVRKVSAHLDVPGSAGSGDSTATYPPRISSRKPKPPPIIVSPPQNTGPTISIQPRALNTREVDPDSLKKPRNVKTFSQSVSPHADSTKARKAVHKLGYAPSSSSKKVISNIRGLFHKRSVESDTTTNDNGAGSFRHSLVPNPLRINPSDGAGGGVDSDDSRGPEHARTRAGARNLIRNPFISPTTPFTATVKPSPYPSRLLSSSSTQQRDNAKEDGSAEEATSIPPPLPSPAETLSNATTLTHSLLDLAHMETDLQRKSHLIQMSKCMVEVVGAARDAEKAMEKAKMEAARAEVSWLKVQKTMGEMVEHVVKVDSLSRRRIE
ncbi:hypothetical protein H2204_005380 [Knufia peltigerae]|uniref:Uncharacterized protein n=1 Tax=Knufia peltigerae TaxID=1002370 RepID=A0AA38Y5G7_9EURO|nr:hypothetical protein H2204_005380 [Knufia peltigerae]